MRKGAYIAIFVPGMLIASCGGDVDRTADTEIIELPINENAEIDEDRIPVITFEDTVIDAGKITQGEFIYHTFSFTNTGKAPLVIASVNGSCGCMVPKSYPKGKIMPGEGGEIDVEFNSDGKWGEQVVSVIISANTIPAATQLLIKTEIVVPDNMKKNK